jgi:hypothetical protein
MYACALSTNWGSYQMLIEELKLRFGSQVYVLGTAWWSQTQELTGKYLRKDGWELEKVTPIRSTGDSEVWVLNVTLKRRTNQYDTIQSSDDDMGWGFGGPPEHLRVYKYENAVLEVPSEFVEKARFRNDNLAP